MSANFFLIDDDYRRKRLAYVCMRIYWRYVLLLAELHRDAKPKIQVLYVGKKKKKEKRKGHIQCIE